MSTHNQSDDLFDLSLRHTLKNWSANEWAVHKDSSSGSRKKLLEAAQREKPVPQRKFWKISLGWLFSLHENQPALAMRPIENIEFEYIDFLKTRMAFL